MGKTRLALLILDGFGIAPDSPSNAIETEGIPSIKAYAREYPSTMIAANGLAVGLPKGQMGNSEVGHLNIGAGRIVYQDFTRVTKSIEDGDFFTNPVLLGAIENCKIKGSSLHLMGLVSDGGVHSHIEHLFAFLKLAKENGLLKVYVHAFMDGRDVPPSSGKGYIQDLQDFIDANGTGRIATVSGRYYAMDRDNRWERVEKAYRALALGEGNTAGSAVEAMEQSYAAGVTDEFVVPTVVTQDGAPLATIRDNDSVIFFNFRPDRAREITRAFTQDGFNGFDLPGGKRKLYFVCLTQYDKSFKNIHVAYKPQGMSNVLGEYLSKCGLTQLRIAETEKYAHVTFFFNGGVEAPFPGENRVLIPSPKVPTYDLQPEMSAYEVANEAARLIREGAQDVVILNFANLDMVGHTGILEAAQKAAKAVDECTHHVVQAVLEQGGVAIITGDHGNAEQMIDPIDGGPFTAHTGNPVPLILAGESVRNLKLREDGRLCDIAPTILQLLGLEKPAEMDGGSLIL
ncbi:MAG: 2,3-bisphosphoglycerate-independent phosphoglycerate mutase [Bacillota bacterium]